MKFVKVKLNEIKDIFNLVKTLRAKLKECNKIKEFYEQEIKNYNKNFTKKGN